MVLIFLVFNLVGKQVKSEEFCVTTSQELYNALFAAGVNGESDHIKIAQGSYIATTAGWQYLEIPSEVFDLKISGGWSDFFNNPCGQNLGGSPLNTTLDANMQGRVLDISPSSNTKIEISNINFINGFIDQPGENGGGVRIDSSTNLDHDVTVENCSFIGNSAFGIGGLLIRDTTKAVIRNNLFILNSAISGKAALNVTGTNKYGYYVTNNTVMLNEGGLSTYAQGTTKVFIANNILWNNDEEVDTYDLSMNGNGTRYLYNNNYASKSGNAGFSSGNISVEPLFEAGLFNFTPSINSQLVGGGKNSPSIVPIPTPFHYGWGIGLTDNEGNPRRVGDEIDIGAVESPHQMYIEIPIFKDGFETQIK